MNSAPPEPTGAPARRKLLWAAFCFVFISTPAALISMPTLFEHFPQLNLLDDYSMVEAGSTLFAGSIIAAFLLARLHSKTTAQLIRRTLGLSFLFVIVFGIVSYTGCMIAG